MIERTNDVITDYTHDAVVTVQKYATPKKISAFFELLMSMLCLIGIDLIKFNFDLSRLKDWKEWVGIAISTVGIFLLYRAVVNARFDKTAMRENVVKARNEYNELNKHKDLTLKDFLKEYNLKTKITNYVAKINHKLYKLEKKRLKTYRVNKCKRLDKKIAELKFKISDEYIHDNIHKIKVKYYIVMYSDFCVETSPIDRKNIATRNTYDKAFTKASLNKMWIYILSSSLIMISAAEPSQLGTTSLVTSILATCLLITTRIVTALLEADKIFDANITNTFLARTEILQEYFEWKKSAPVLMSAEELKEHDAEIKEQMKIEFEKKASEIALKFTNMKQ